MWHVTVTIVNNNVTYIEYYGRDAVGVSVWIVIGSFRGNPHTHTPHDHVYSSSLLSSVSVQDSCLRCDHETRYQAYYSFYPNNPEYTRSLDPSVLVISLSLHRHPFICILFISRFTCYNITQ
jgi:hypothetical protein